MLEDIKSGSKFVKRLTIKTGRTVLLPTDEIDWIETHRNYLKVLRGIRVAFDRRHDAISGGEAQP
jgi:DNA-binding LytR/AlgR family response regulator